MEKLLDMSQSADGTIPNSTETINVDLSCQLQVVNLGFLGRQSNLFELASTYVDYSLLPLFSNFKTKVQTTTGGNKANLQS